MLVQTAGLIGGAPFMILCGQARSAPWLVVALTSWGLFRTIYDANIFTSVFDVIRPEAVGRWLGVGGS
jgi:hypothetical protein